MILKRHCRISLFVVLLCALSFVAGFDATDFVNTPHHQVHKSCVHGVESGSLVERDASGNYFVTNSVGAVKRFPPCPHQPEARIHGRAWKAWTQYHNTTGFSYMSANWVVPPFPDTPSSAEILYYWPGTEPDDNSFVIQPVLQFGAGPAGGGLYWAVASWYVGDRAFFSPLLQTTPGDNIFGSMNQNSNNGSWTIISESTNLNQSVSLVTKNALVPQTYAYCVLEAYNLINCVGQYPAGVTQEPFTNLVTKVNNVVSQNQWVAMTKNPRICNEHATITSDSQTAIVWCNTKGCGVQN